MNVKEKKKAISNGKKEEKSEKYKRIPENITNTSNAANKREERGDIKKDQDSVTLPNSKVLEEKKNKPFNYSLFLLGLLFLVSALGLTYGI